MVFLHIKNLDSNNNKTSKETAFIWKITLVGKLPYDVSTSSHKGKSRAYHNLKSHFFTIWNIVLLSFFIYSKNTHVSSNYTLTFIYILVWTALSLFFFNLHNHILINSSLFLYKWPLILFTSVLVSVILLSRDTTTITTLMKESIVAYSSTGSVHYHQGGKHCGTQADMVVEK